jgi:hypothetical protein
MGVPNDLPPWSERRPLECAVLTLEFCSRMLWRELSMAMRELVYTGWRLVHEQEDEHRCARTFRQEEEKAERDKIREDQEGDDDDDSADRRKGTGLDGVEHELVHKAATMSKARSPRRKEVDHGDRDDHVADGGTREARSGIPLQV